MLILEGIYGKFHKFNTPIFCIKYKDDKNDDIVPGLPGFIIIDFQFQGVLADKDGVCCTRHDCYVWSDSSTCQDQYRFV